jgi:1,2-phenylacetyl-CoA epoxidase catalytic subunit
MFTDKVDLKDFEKQDPEYQDLLRRVLSIQADCEIGGPNLYVKEILPNAPTKLDQLIVARTAAEEMDHYRKIAKLAGDIGVDVSFRSQPSPTKIATSSVSRRNQNLGRLRVFGILIDRGRPLSARRVSSAVTYLPLARVVEDP